jgi:hypothetical protein
MARIKQGDRFINRRARSKNREVEVTRGPKGGRFQVATVDGDRLINRRWVPIERFNPDGYVKVGATEDSAATLAIVRPASQRSALKDAPRCAEMSTESLVAYVARLEAEAKVLKERISDAKAEVKSRRGDPEEKGSGVEVYGDLVAEFSSARTFNGKLAKARLTPAKYQEICALKPDATRAKVILGADSPEYAAVTEASWRLTIREATDEERRSTTSRDESCEEGLDLPDDLLMVRAG